MTPARPLVRLAPGVADFHWQRMAQPCPAQCLRPAALPGRPEGAHLKSRIPFANSEVQQCSSRASRGGDVFGCSQLLKEPRSEGRQSEHAPEPAGAASSSLPAPGAGPQRCALCPARSSSAAGAVRHKPPQRVQLLRVPAGLQARFFLTHLLRVQNCLANTPSTQVSGSQLLASGAQLRFPGQWAPGDAPWLEAALASPSPLEGTPSPGHIHTATTSSAAAPCLRRHPGAAGAAAGGAPGFGVGRRDLLETIQTNVREKQIQGGQSCLRIQATPLCMLCLDV